MWNSLFNRIRLDTGALGVLPISLGGSGADNASDARTNFDVYSTSEVDALIAAADEIDGEVDYFADLPSAVINDGKTYYVKSWSISNPSKLSGLYLAQSSAWVRRSDKVTYSLDPFTAAGRMLKTDGAGREVVESANIPISANLVTGIGGQTDLTYDSSGFQVLQGSSSQNFNLGNATTYPDLGKAYVFYNDTAANTLYVAPNGGASIKDLAAGCLSLAILTDKSTAAGSWAVKDIIPQDIRATASPTFAGLNLGIGALTSHSIKPDATDGLLIESNNGTDIGLLGAANTANALWYGIHQFNALTASRILSLDSSKNLTSLDTATYPSLAELAYVKGVTSAIQTQLNAKEASITADTTAKYWRGDKTFQTLNQAAVAGLTTSDSPTFTGVFATTGTFTNGGGSSSSAATLIARNNAGYNSGSNNTWLSLLGQYNSGGSYAAWLAISALKKNGTDGNTYSQARIYVNDNSSSNATSKWMDVDGQTKQTNFFGALRVEGDKISETVASVSYFAHSAGKTRLYSNGVDASTQGSFEMYTRKSDGTSQVLGLGITGSGNVYGAALHNNSTAPTGTTNQYIASGTYTPTLTGVANVGASTAYGCSWIRVGNVVTVSGRVDIDPTLTATLTQLGISLPIASNFSAANQCAGTANASAIASLSAAILGDATNDRAEMDYVSTDVTNQPMYFTFTYVIL